MLTILPTDTCYGLAGDFTEKDYHAIYEAKGRSFEKRLAVLVDDFSMLSQYGIISASQLEFLRTYPFPWSVILPRNDTATFPVPLQSPDYAYISFRVATPCMPESLRNTLHYPLFLTSANLSGNPESKTLIEASVYFPGISGYDGGVCDRPPSDIFRLGEHGELEYVRRNYGI